MNNFISHAIASLTVSLFGPWIALLITQPSCAGANGSSGVYEYDPYDHPDFEGEMSALGTEEDDYFRTYEGICTSTSAPNHCDVYIEGSIERDYRDFCGRRNRRPEVSVTWEGNHYRGWGRCGQSLASAEIDRPGPTYDTPARPITPATSGEPQGSCDSEDWYCDPNG